MVLTAKYLNCLPQGMISDCFSDKPCFKLRFALTLASLSPWSTSVLVSPATGPVTDQQQASTGTPVVSVTVTGVRGGRQEPGVQAHSQSGCCAQILLCAGENALRDKSFNSQLEDEAIMTHCSSHELLCAFFSLLTEWLM